ncbi:MAG TPA: hypothetical protein VMK12_02445 [Anaeromyxobacteraceae bacterium]|nr:hypothetical protein [Anaeromyxobacteraceae bacterium]
MTVGGLPAKMLVQRPGECHAIGSDVSITVDIARPAEPNYYQLLACIKGPGVSTAVARVKRILATTHIKGL